MYTLGSNNESVSSECSLDNYLERTGANLTSNVLITFPMYRDLNKYLSYFSNGSIS